MVKKRLIYKKILDQRDSRKASIIIGPRQVGKTILLQQLHRRLGGLFFDTDIFTDYEQVSTYEKFISTLKIRGYRPGQAKKFFVFLDEFQRYPDLSRVIKSVYDHHENIKIFATGSSSLEIKNSIQESLAGRKTITYIYPFDFEEFLFFKNQISLAKQIRRLPGIKTEDYFASIPKARTLFEEFLVFGGYPEVVLSRTDEEKRETLRSIFDLYIKKDFAEFAKAEKLRSASQLMKMLAVNNGQAANYAKYAASAGINIETVKNYITILKETYIVSVIRPYFTNKNKEISKMPRVYFLDNGVRNFFLSDFSSLEARSDAGALYEGFYISQLLKNGMDPDSIKYYRTKSGEEVDIVLDKHPHLVPIEIKSKKSPGARDVAAVRRFVEKRSLPSGFVVTTGKIGKKDRIEFVDFFRIVK